jgi:hypothetical protein
MYKDLCEELISRNHIPVCANYRTGASADESFKNVCELISSYPKSMPKAIIAHDWGAVFAWRLDYVKLNVKKLILMSVGPITDNRNSTWNYRFYQLFLTLLKPLTYIYPQAINVLNSWIKVNELDQNEKEFFNSQSLYFYNLRDSLEFLFGIRQHITDLSSLKFLDSIDMLYSQVDSDFGFVSDLDKLEEISNFRLEKQSEPSHYFYFKNKLVYNNRFIEIIEENHHCE